MSRIPRAIKINEIESLRQITAGSSWKLLSRSTAVLLPITVAFALLILVTGNVQVSAGAQSVYRSEQNVVTTKTVTPPRGLFYDRNGQKLTANVDSYTLSLKPGDFPGDKLDAVLGIISKDSNVSVDDLKVKVQGHTSDAIPLLTGLTSAQTIILSNSLKDLPVNIVTDVKRQYLFPTEFAQVIGYTGLADANDIKAGFTSTDEVGKYRLEKVLDSQLRGVKGQVANTAAGPSTVDSVAGNNVFLTLDAQWQQWLYKIMGNQVDQLGGEGGAAAIVDVSNGDVRGYVSYPSFDPNKFADGISSADYNQLLADIRKPLIDKVISTQTSPGSTYKLIAAYAALQYGAIDGNFHVFSNRCMQVGDHPFCEYGHFFIGDMDVVRALARSSNIFFCTSILKLSAEQGFQKYIDAAKLMGMGSPTGIILDGEVSGILATPDLKTKLYGQQWFEGDTCNSIIGQGMTAVTPLQMAMMVSTFYNGGNYYQPNIIDKITDQDGNVVQSDFHKLERTIPMSDNTTSLIQAGMYNVVNTSEGTDYWYLHFVPLNFYAKTGSAETYDVVNGQIIPKVDGWIEGKFDYQGKTFAFAADIKFAGGGWNASQVMMRFGNCLVNNFADGCDQI